MSENHPYVGLVGSVLPFTDSTRTEGIVVHADDRAVLLLLADGSHARGPIDSLVLCSVKDGIARVAHRVQQ